MLIILGMDFIAITRQYLAAPKAEEYTMLFTQKEEESGIPPPQIWAAEDESIHWNVAVTSHHSWRAEVSTTWAPTSTCVSLHVSTASNTRYLLACLCMIFWSSETDPSKAGQFWGLSW